MRLCQRFRLELIAPKQIEISAYSAQFYAVIA